MRSWLNEREQAWSREHGAEGMEQRAWSREQGAESMEQRAWGREHGAESRGQRAGGVELLSLTSQCLTSQSLTSLPYLRSMQLQDIIGFLETIAPPSLQESYDNAGLIVGDPGRHIDRALICLDSTPEVVQEAVSQKAGLIIAHHPIVFSGLKKFNGKTHVEQAVMLAIKHDIAIYAIHTNLDNVLQNGVNQKIAEKLGLTDLRILQPKQGSLCKLVVFCPDVHADTVRNAMFGAGAGTIGKYDSCSFSAPGEGSFRGGEDTAPYVGKSGELHREEELRIETVVPRHLVSKVVAAMKKAHPYEEVAYDVYTLENEWEQVGAGLTGNLPSPLEPLEFLELVKSRMNVPMIRYTASKHERIEKVALCGGSGSFLLKNAMKAGAQVFLTSDFKYHQFFEGENQVMIADIGHYEGEYFTIELLGHLLTKKFPTFAVVFSGINTNPINYFF